jgi:hypothetical protein
MRDSGHNADGPYEGVRPRFRLLESWIDARTEAQRLFFLRMRGSVSGMPLLDAGMQLAEAVARQRSELANFIVGRVERSIAARGRAHPDRPRAPYAEERIDEAAQTADVRADAPQSAPALRLAIARGTRNVAVPLQLRNHRQVSDVVSVSAVPPGDPSVATIPVEFFSFEPRLVTIPPMSEGMVQLVLRLGPDFVHVGEFWSEIVIDGVETKRVPLVLQIQPEAPTARSQ